MVEKYASKSKAFDGDWWSDAGRIVKMVVVS